MTGWAELHATLEDYTRNWYLGPDTRVPEPTPNAAQSPEGLQGKALEYKEGGVWGPQSWTQAVKMEVPNLFSLGHNAVKVSLKCSFLYSSWFVPVAVCVMPYFLHVDGQDEVLFLFSRVTLLKY